VSQTDDFGLSAFDEELKPSEGFSNKLEDLPDGDYEFLITKTAMKRNEKVGYPIFEMTLQVLSGERAGVTGTKAVFFKEQGNVDIFAGELGKLGFDTKNWTVANKRPFSVEFSKAIPQLPGLAFKGVKKKAKDNVHFNINVKELLLGRRVIPAEAAAGKADANDPF
jgi:hypothetical protein